MQGMESIERISFFMMMVLLLTHFIGCFWIFIGINFHDFDNIGDSWIEAGGYEDAGMFELYIVSIYFAM